MAITNAKPKSRANPRQTLVTPALPAVVRDLELETATESCTRTLAGHGPRATSDLLATIPPDTAKDFYGNGGVVSELEAEVAGLLGKEKALFLLTGTMAQQATLRVHADRRNNSRIAFHPACHLDSHEERGYQYLHGLHGIPVGGRNQPLTTDALKTVGERVGALVIELPQRDIGGTLPDWKELTAQVDWARKQGAAAHLDGARLWEASAHYKATSRKSLSDIANLFDTVYVSFYKGLGGIAGCCVAGDADVIDELSVWRVRHGGRVFGMWPYAASALTVLRRRLPLMPKYHRHAVAIGRALASVEGIDVFPNPGQSTMMHLRARIAPHEMRARAIAIAQSDSVFTFARPFSEDGGLCTIEFSVGDSTLEMEPAEIASILSRLLTP